MISLEKLEQIRQEKGYTHAKMAKLTHIPPRTYTHIREGKRISKATQELLLSVFPEVWVDDEIIPESKPENPFSLELNYINGLGCQNNIPLIMLASLTRLTHLDYTNAIREAITSFACVSAKVGRLRKVDNDFLLLTLSRYLRATSASVDTYQDKHALQDLQHSYQQLFSNRTLSEGAAESFPEGLDCDFDLSAGDDRIIHTIRTVFHTVVVNWLNLYNSPYTYRILTSIPTIICSDYDDVQMRHFLFWSIINIFNSAAGIDTEGESSDADKSLARP